MRRPLLEPGQLGNTVTRKASFLSLPGTSGNYASTPDSAAVSITGDIDYRIRLSVPDWTPAVAGVLLSKWNSGTQKSFLVFLNIAGTLSSFWSTTGADEPTAGTGGSAVPFIDGEIGWIRVTRVQSSGLVQHYTSNDGVTWTPLGGATPIAAGSAIFNSTAPLELGRNGDGIQYQEGKFYYAELRNGIDGPVVAKFDPTETWAEEDTFTSSTGEVWTINRSGQQPARLV